MGKHRKEGPASRYGCAVIVMFAAPLLILLATLADQAIDLIS
ncbi:hypothetical protein ACIQUM_20730 [Amycolatopsis azurea]